MAKNNKKYTIEEVRKDFEEKDYILISTVYENLNGKLDYICNKHKELGIQQTTYKLIKTRKNNCESCKKRIKTWRKYFFLY